MKPLQAAPVLVVFLAVACNGTAKEAARRSFRFEYETMISGFPEGAKQARVWLPLPGNDEAQTVTNVELDAPVPHRVGKESIYGNRVAYIEVDAPLPEELPITLTVDVTRTEVSSVERLAGSPRLDRLLAGDRLAPLDDEAKTRAQRATAGRASAEARARGIYDRVLADVDYDKSGEGWGRGDLRYVCEAGKGNCSDFHTLFIAMARSTQIPAVFEIGFPLPVDREEGAIGGYHCWAWYQDGDGRWRPVDVSEADKEPTRTDYFFGTICENRVAFSRGRDLILDPPQSDGPVNFLIYPYVEIDGKSGVAEVENRFRFKNL